MTTCIMFFLSIKRKEKLEREKILKLEQIIRNQNKSNLANREIEVLMQVAKGKKPADIAIDLNISPKTVYKHKDNIKFKTGCKTDEELMEFVNSFG